VIIDNIIGDLRKTSE